MSRLSPSLLEILNTKLPGGQSAHYACILCAQYAEDKLFKLNLLEYRDIITVPVKLEDGNTGHLPEYPKTLNSIDLTL
jgi:hypothetical protein